MSVKSPKYSKEFVKEVQQSMVGGTLLSEINEIDWLIEKKRCCDAVAEIVRRPTKLRLRRLMTTSPRTYRDRAKSLTMMLYSYATVTRML